MSFLDFHETINLQFQLLLHFYCYLHNSFKFPFITCQSGTLFSLSLNDPYKKSANATAERVETMRRITLATSPIFAWNLLCFSLQTWTILCILANDNYCLMAQTYYPYSPWFFVSRALRRQLRNLFRGYSCTSDQFLADSPFVLFS